VLACIAAGAHDDTASRMDGVGHLGTAALPRAARDRSATTRASRPM
jgi:hypothetical protein